MKIHTVPVGAIGTNCYFVEDERTRRCAVIDPGDEPVRLLIFLEQHGLTAKYIFLTHGHFDHITGVQKLRTETGASVVIHQSDVPFLSDRSLSYSRSKAAIDPPDIEASDGLEIPLDNLTFKWLSTPGHTPGSSVILCKNAIFSGDTLFYEECGRCDLHGGDYSQMLASLRRLSALEGDYDVYPGHGAASTLSHERAHNPYMKEALTT